ncbi:CpXC domain-containing protein [Flavobacterium sp.]|jgi:hypothetical protein|uniref:CpXC domain-containing protein n=1 Tax=Flavobacterium sp. TaxID=239 RepID=UPI0037BFB3FB
MSRLVTYNIPCPKCKEYGNYQIFHSVNTNIEGIVNKLLHDKINFVQCEHCTNIFHIKTGLLFNNMEKMYAIYYNPDSFEQNEKESVDIKRMLGDNFYLANPSRFKDWELFKQELKRKENIVQKVNLGSSRNFSTSSSIGSFDNFWSCEICDGNSETGCLYFDSTECPRHT